MAGVLFEGGSFRAVFSCGVMDALLEKEIYFPYCIGVSAGAADAASYISKQKGRNIRVFEKYRNDKRYVGKIEKRNPIHRKQKFRYCQKNNRHDSNDGIQRLSRILCPTL